MEGYEEFIKSKKKKVLKSGFESKSISDKLFDFQQFIVKESLNHGKYAIFADTGLGKTLMQGEIARQVFLHENKKVLILAPLGVVSQTIEEIKSNLDFNDIGKGCNVNVINYEQLDNINENDYCCVILDESSILKNFVGKTKQKLVDKFKDTEYKFCLTATPSPNDETEILNHAEFLGVATRQEVLATYFIQNIDGESSKWRLKKHAESDFYAWLQSWCVMVHNPSDIGFDGSRYILPELYKHLQIIETESKDNGLLFNSTAVSATEFNSELRDTLKERAEATLNILNTIDKNDQVLIWINQDVEAQELLKLIPDAIEVKGSHSPEIKEKRLSDFAHGKYRILITKSSIAGMGLNFQNCHNTIFMSIDFSFEKLYQAIRRFWRFGQTYEVNAWIISTDTMGNVIQSIEEKEEQFQRMRLEMIKKLNLKKEVTLMEDFTKQKGENWELWNGDTFRLIKDIESDSIGLSVFSPPFPELYVYSDNIEDMNNCDDINQFFTQFEYMIPELSRIMMPGRNVCIHCMDKPVQKSKAGYIGLSDFPAQIREMFEKYGFIYHSKITIWKDPVVEMQRTKALGLLHKQIKKDSAMNRAGLPDYILVMRTPGENEIPIQSGDDIPVDLWQQYASPVWMDINYSDTLNKKNAKENKDEKHLTPLQLPTIKRCIDLWSNKGEIVFDPFMGIGSTAWQALKMNRKAMGIELKKSYFEESLKNMARVKKANSQLTLV